MTTTIAVAAPAMRRPYAVGPPRPPNRLAEHITGRTYLSHSQLSLMRSCPRKFSFLYVEKTPPDFIPNSLIFGGSIHAAVELWYRCKLEGLGVTEEALLSAYHDAWSRQVEKAREQAGKDVPIQFAKNQDADALHALAARMITAFLASPPCEPQGRDRRHRGGTAGRAGPGAARRAGQGRSGHADGRLAARRRF